MFFSKIASISSSDPLLAPFWGPFWGSFWSPLELMLVTFEGLFWKSFLGRVLDHIFELLGSPSAAGSGLWTPQGGIPLQVGLTHPLRHHCVLNAPNSYQKR